MIEQRIQSLIREAVIKVCIQGTRAGYVPGGDIGEFACLYTDHNNKHCVVGHALTAEQQAEVGTIRAGVGTLTERFQHIALRLGIDKKKTFNQDPHQQLWSEMQSLHDMQLDTHRGSAYWSHPCRPFGVSWSAYFWVRSRNLCRQFGFDIGNYPRKEVQDAQAS